MTRAQPLIQTLPMTLGAPMSDDPSNPTAIEIPLQIELPNGQTLFAAVALGGHHDPKAFRAQAVIDWGLRTDPSEAGEDIETPKHGYMRIVPRDGYSNWHEPAKGPGPGAFPVTTAPIYWERPTQAAKK